MIVKADDLVASPTLDITIGSNHSNSTKGNSSQHSTPDRQGVSGSGDGSVALAATTAPPQPSPLGAAVSMDDVQSVGSSLGKSSHSSHHSRHSHASSSTTRRSSTPGRSTESHQSGADGKGRDRERHHHRRSSSTRHVQHQERHHHRDHQRHHSGQSGSGTPPCGRDENRNNTKTSNAYIATGVDKQEVASMYLDTKQNMLEIIEEGLHMKLELKNIKQQFLSLLENYDSYQRAPVAPLPAAMKAETGVPVTDEALSAPRARVRALYEARRARLHARRSVSSNASSSSSLACRSERRLHREANKENETRRPARCNVLKDSNALASDQKYGNSRKLSTSTPPACKPHKRCACHPRSTPGNSFLAPIKEEALRQHPPPRYRSGLNSGTATSQTLSDLEGEYVTLRSPSGEQSMEVSMEVDSVSDMRGGTASPGGALYQSRQSEFTPNKQDETSIWVNTNDDLDVHCPQLLSDDSMVSNKENLPHHAVVPNSRSRESPVKYASSNVISELYTSKSLSNLKDVSQISRLSMSSQTLREQSSGSNICNMLNYPLHSTLNYPLHSTLNMSTEDPELEPIPHDKDPLDEPQPSKCFSDVRTTISEPSAVLRRRKVQGTKERNTLRSLDDSIVDIKSLQRQDSGKRPVTSMSTASERSRRNKSRTARTRRRERLKERERQAAQTPLTSREPQLCREHGLHPTFGGPCIFQTDDSFTMSETTTEDDVDDDVRPRSSTAVTETDNDSSYLSECVDDNMSGHFMPARARAEDYTATYDARNGRMRMLRRQTGQTVLDKQQLRSPLGLSESDFLMDVTRKHLSLEATRSSLPDLSAFSTTTNSECGHDELDDPEADISEDTLHASQVMSMKDSDGFWSPNSLDDTVVSTGTVSSHHGGPKERPLSISTSTTTSTTESPESTESRDMPVPVNSPNVTDSGSSRPTTDNYDYVDVPKFQIMGPPTHLPPRHHPNVQMRRRHHQSGSRPPCTVGRHATAGSSSSSTAGENNGSDVGARYETRSEGRGAGARKCLRYHHDYDSGFSTPGSGRRHILLSDSAGNTRTVVQHSAVARNLQHDRKKQLVKKIKQFSNTFYKSTGNLHIHTLGHF